MRRPLRHAVVLQLLVAVSAFAQEKVVHETLTLEQSLTRAYASNPQLLQADRDLAISRINSKEARALYYPKVNLNLNYIRYRNETLGVTPPELGSAVLEAPIRTPTGSRGNPLAENLYLGRIGFVQTLFAGGRLNYTYKLSQANVKQAESDYETSKRRIGYETTKAFNTLVAIKEKRAAIEDALKRIGRSSGDLAAAQARSNLRRALVALEHERRSANYDYLQSMGVEVFSDVDVNGVLEVTPVELDMKTALVWAKQNRSDWRQTQLQAEVDQLSVNLALAERYPVFLLGGAVEMRNSKFPIDETNWNTALSMNIPLFDGISIPTRIKESRYKADRGRYYRAQLEDEIERQVRSAFEDLTHWQEELTARRTDAAEAFDLRGAGPRAVEYAAQSKISVIDAQYELCMAKARLQQAVGRAVETHP